MAGLPSPLPLLHRLAWAGQCEVCRSWCAQGLCLACLRNDAQPASRCTQCALPLARDQASPCPACRNHPPAHLRGLCVADYGFPWDRLITRLKYHQEPGLARALARPMAEVLTTQGGACDLILPLPLSRRRLRNRGFNQAWELARRVAAHCQVPARADVLLRVLEASSAQAELGRQARLRALAGAFMVNPRHGALLRQAHVTLVDDVMTTGATVAEAASVLMRAGAASVSVLVFARTPAPQSKQA